MGMGGGGDPGGQCRRREIMIDQQGEGGVQHGDRRLVGRAGGELRPQLPGQSGAARVRRTLGRRRCVRGHGQRTDQGRNEAPRRGEHRLAREVEAERIGGRRGDHRHAQPVRRAAVRGQRVDRPARRGQRLGRCREPDAGPQLAGPEPLADLLVGVPPGQLGRIDAAEVVAVVLDQRDAGVEDQVAGGGGGGPAAGAPGQRVDLRGVERAAASARGAAAAQLAPADIRVHRLGLHAEALGRLPGAEPPWRGRLRTAAGRCLILHAAHHIHID
jgi:hypothetical protein